MVDDHCHPARKISVLVLGHPYYGAKPLDGSWVGGPSFLGNKVGLEKASPVFFSPASQANIPYFGEPQ